MKSKRNTLPVAPFNLREMGPTSEADLKKNLGFFRYAHGKGSDRRATLDPEPCPHCHGKVEWTLTYKREGGDAIPYVYARCRTSPKSHRWDFTHWAPSKATPQSKAQTETLLRASLKMAAHPAHEAPTPKIRPPKPPPPSPVPAPRPSVGTELMASWLDRRIDILAAELDRLTTIRKLAGEVATMEGVEVRSPRPIGSPVPSFPGVAPNGTPV